MATDVDVQFFSHLNGLTLDNNWGDLIRMLDKALVSGIDFTQITAVSIDEQGDVHITLYSAHNAMLFQVVELSGFVPGSLNQKYRIKGVPNSTKLILKPKTDIIERSINTTGTAKLASLGYEIIFRDTNDVKRVYRAKNPTAQHPFIRVDESISSDTGSYTSTYAKYAMVGLLEHMEHIDDYENPDVLQLPFDPVDPTKNWKIAGTGTGVVRGWAKWIWATSVEAINTTTTLYTPPTNNPRLFTLVGDSDAFYLLNSRGVGVRKLIAGCGNFDSIITDSNVTPEWFLMSTLNTTAAASGFPAVNAQGGSSLAYNSTAATFFVSKKDTQVSSDHTVALPILPDFLTGASDLYSATHIAALQIPFSDAEKNLRGTLKHVAYSGNNLEQASTTPLLSGSSMYVYDHLTATSATISKGGLYFYLGELE